MSIAGELGNDSKSVAAEWGEAKRERRAPRPHPMHRSLHHERRKPGGNTVPDSNASHAGADTPRKHDVRMCQLATLEQPDFASCASE
jgi:hypothetical protein